MSRSAFLHPFARPAADHFVTITEGEGAVVWDDAGTRYVDALASLWYCQVGHGRAEIADAVHTQMRRLEAFHTFEMFTNEPAEQFCAEVAATSPMDDPRVFLTDSGSESVETVIKLARMYWSWQGRPERDVVVSRERAYHGVGYGGTTAQGLPPNKEHWGPLLTQVEHAGADDLESVREMFADHGDRIAAVITEPVQGAGGVFPPEPGYLEGLRALCDEHGALLVFDEVICGFGRLGNWWGSQRFGVVPDLTTFAKGATSGYLPLGGVLVGRKVLDVLEADATRWLRHGFTYSGHPTACAAGLANMAVLRDEGLLGRAAAIEAVLRPGLQSLVDEGLAAGLRGTDGIWGLAMAEGVSAMDVRDEMLARGVIPRPIATHTVAVCPPLVIGDDDLHRIVEVAREALMAVAKAAT